MKLSREKVLHLSHLILGHLDKDDGVEYFDELAVMVDTFRPLELGEAGLAADDGLYASSWSRGGPQTPGPGSCMVP